MVLTVCLAVLGLAAALKPNPNGLGTHRQLGYSTCPALMISGYPCPTCGMTTAFAHTIRGELAAAFHAQPAGFALALATTLIAAIASFTAVTGRVWVVNWYRVSPVWVPIGLAGLLFSGWVYKMTTGLAAGTLPFGGS